MYRAGYFTLPGGGAGGAFRELTLEHLGGGRYGYRIRRNGVYFCRPTDGSIAPEKYGYVDAGTTPVLDAATNLYVGSTQGRILKVDATVVNFQIMNWGDVPMYLQWNRPEVYYYATAGNVPLTRGFARPLAPSRCKYFFGLGSGLVRAQQVSYELVREPL